MPIYSNIFYSAKNITLLRGVYIAMHKPIHNQRKSAQPL